MSFSTWIGGFVLLLGLSFVGFGTYQFFKIKNFKGSAAETQGFVLRLNERRHQGKTTYAPTVRYTLPDGREMRYHHDIFSRPSSYDVGESVTVFYDPQHPEQVRLADDYFSVYILGGLGAAFTFFGSLMASGGRKPDA
jgi:hypothetical protein